MKVRTIGSGRQIEEILKSGSRRVVDPFVIYHHPAPGQTGSSIAIQVPRRVGGAVRRNRIRRRLKEVCRKAFPRFVKEAQFILIARPRAVSFKFSQVQALLEEFFKREGFLPHGANALASESLPNETERDGNPTPLHDDPPKGER